MDELSLQLAGLRTAILTRDSEVAELVKGRYRGFLSEGAPDWRMKIEVGPTGPVPFADSVVVRRNGGAARFVVQRQDFVGTLDLKERTGQLALAEPDEISLDCFLRVAYSLALVDACGLLVHAASLMRDGKAYLFCGRSGSGKTTVARLSSEATLLSDEISMVRTHEGHARCYGTPFWGELARGGENRSAPLVGIYFLRQATRHAVEVLKPRQALQQLLPNVLFFAREAQLTAHVLNIAADLVAAVPCFDLAFLPDPGFWRVIAHA